MSFAPPDISDFLKRDMDSLASVRALGDGVISVTTHCMYPSNGLVRVTVRTGFKTVMVYDDGGAVGEALSAGIPFKESDRLLTHLVDDQGLFIDNGIIRTPQMPLEAAPLGVLLVANASKEVAHWLYDHAKIKRSRDFRVMLAEFLAKTFDDRVAHNAVIVGHSNKAHKFANVISFGDDQKLIIDPVANDASSINARVVANLDVKASGNPKIAQRIVFDDEEGWKASDLNLLGVGAIAIPFSKSRDVIQRIAHIPFQELTAHGLF
jgi:hypothetical protein